jgi:hypothetical protein
MINCLLSTFTRCWIFTTIAQALVARTHHPPFSNFLLTNLFSIKFLYFFIISFLFPYFNLFVSMFVQSYVNIKLHVSALSQYLDVLSGEIEKNLYIIDVFRNRWLPSYRSWTLGGVTIVRHYESVKIDCLH